MKATIEAEIKKLAKQAGEQIESGKAMQFSQAALNLAHVLATFAAIPKQS